MHSLKSITFLSTLKPVNHYSIIKYLSTDDGCCRSNMYIQISVQYKKMEGEMCFCINV